MTNSKQAAGIIRKLFTEDQRDRAAKKLKSLSAEERWRIIGVRDTERRQRLTTLLKTKPKLESLDYFRAGIIFQHGPTQQSIRRAQQMARKGMRLGSRRAAWLYAAATDRLRVMQGKKQKFGTQYCLKHGAWKLYPVLSTTTDEERARYNVIPLKQAMHLNLKHMKKRGVGLTRRRM